MQSERRVKRGLITHVKHFRKNGELTRTTKGALRRNGYFLADEAIAAWGAGRLQDAEKSFERSATCFARLKDPMRAALCLQERAKVLDAGSAEVGLRKSAYNDAGDYWIKYLRILKKGKDGFWTHEHLTAIDRALGCFKAAGQTEKWNQVRKYYDGEIETI